MDGRTIKSYDRFRLQQALLTALATPALSAQSASLLGTLGTAESQRALVELASQTDYPLELRQAAAKAFAASVKKYRILLTTTEMLRQYDRYNRSAQLDRGTQSVLSSILDSLEGPSQAANVKPQGVKRLGPPKPLTR